MTKKKKKTLLKQNDKQLTNNISKQHRLHTKNIWLTSDDLGFNNMAQNEYKNSIHILDLVYPRVQLHIPYGLFSFNQFMIFKHNYHLVLCIYIYINIYVCTSVYFKITSCLYYH